MRLWQGNQTAMIDQLLRIWTQPSIREFLSHNLIAPKQVHWRLSALKVPKVGKKA